VPYRIGISSVELVPAQSAGDVEYFAADALVCLSQGNGYAFRVDDKGHPLGCEHIHGGHQQRAAGRRPLSMVASTSSTVTYQFQIAGMP